MKRTSVLLGEDHRVLIECVTQILSQDFHLIAVARDGQELIEMARQHKPDIIVTEISMPQRGGIDAVRVIRKEVPSARILFIAMHTTPPIVEEAFRAGASGFVLKVAGVREFIKAIRAVAEGGTYISPRLAGHLTRQS
jgi:DNA-binding NarL/FixJ family response regulator